jgi:6-phosphogluconolactonase
MEVTVLGDPAALAEAAAREVLAIGTAAILRHGRFLIALSGGSTPRAMHARLTAPDLREVLDWSSVEFFWSDERAVPPDHPDSNYGMARTTLLLPLDISDPQVHRMRGEALDLEAAAREYEQEIADVCGGTPGRSAPVLGLVLIGMGADGHTASLFPRTPALDEETRWVVTNTVPRQASRRLTVTFPVIQAARDVRVVAGGAEKADTLHAVLRGPRDARRLPAQRLAEARGRVVWLADAAAADRL